MKEHSEDIWTTILLHQHGYESIFYNKILAKGRAPDSIRAFFRQQNRWAQGGFSLFFSHNPLFVENLTTDQRLQYIFSNFHYFSAFAICIYLILPIIYLLFGIHPMNIKHSEAWLMHYLPYFLTIYFIPVFLLGSTSLATISTSLASFSPYISAFFKVVMKNKYRWVATNSSESQFSLIMFEIWPHIFIIALSVCAVLVGWYNTDEFPLTAVTSFWVLVNAYLLFIFVKRGISSV